MTKTKNHDVLFWIFFVLLCAVSLTLLELNKNSLAAWIGTLALLIGYAVLRLKKLKGKHFYLRAAAFLAISALLLSILLHVGRPYRFRPAVEKSGGMTGVIELRDGKVQGVLTADKAVEVYTGIPYAKPPVGELRWKAPQDPEPWGGVRTCTHFAAMAMQPRSSEIYNSLSQIVGFHDFEVSVHDNFRDAVSEDALYLNIWKPAGAGEKLPVLVYIHGGSLQTGQPWYADYSGEGLARKGILVVNLGYRLGVFGFLATEELAAEDPNHSTGNYGLMDQIKALEWVRDNIAAFGGDPDNVTLSGESAGAACVTALCTSPEAKGLFRRAIAESSTTTAPVPQHSFRLMDEALKTGRETMERFKASSIEELRALPAEQLVAAADTNHHLTVDGYILPVTPYEAYRNGIHNEEASLQGFNQLEATPFILFEQANKKNYEGKVRDYFGEEADALLAGRPGNTNAEAEANWTDIYSTIFFTYGHHIWSKQEQELGIPTYRYYFTKDNGRLGTWHSGEEVYLYGNVPEKDSHYDESDRELSKLWVKYFANFARTGNPNGEGLPTWEAATDLETLMEMGTHVGPVKDPFLDIYPAMDGLRENGKD